MTKPMTDLEKMYLQECEEIARECQKEGYPSHGSNYELRCEEIRKYYDREIEKLSHDHEIKDTDIELQDYCEFWKEFDKNCEEGK